MKDNYGVIMAGGIGSRFWPMSQEHMPKQFLDVLGIGKTLIQMTVDRLKKIAPADQIFVMTNEDYADLVHQQTGLPYEQILTEPMRKNTAPCIAYAAHKIHSLNPNGNLVVAPSDHLIVNEDEFVRIINTAIDTAQNNRIVTLGIKPSRPDTGYGYIHFDSSSGTELGTVKEVIQFTEKPDHDKAKQFVASGDYYWNSGIFIWKSATVIEALSMFKPDMNNLFSTSGTDYNTDKEQAHVNNAFEKCESVSIDYAVLEPADNVSVVLADFGWSDLGTWGSLYTHLKQDENGNAVIGNKVKMFESSNCIVNLPNGKKALIQGLDDYIVVEANDTLMIIRKEDEQKIKQYSTEVDQ
ncbi:mannose-1-phosphate guanylyltransferase [Paracrocinitomix mangrovi]|uniref:mannose-1-phosphate guanylyltransferase n=1 Tax=Paracrocinitomix mangrovi TaxID=2862509 RepID=UPI001C8DDA11|nr:mannose-1-phosphate guanylyltransferase [Paracrocinitomix mangrovi]UKN00991.1 mannose-1-phosphate guanylyltransferase [Paracrocinitomix mangrovi]